MSTLKPISDEDVILSIDPGNVYSAYCYLLGKRIGSFGKIPNKQMLEIVKDGEYDHIVSEVVTSYGMAVGASIFDTCIVIGQIIQASELPVTLMPRIQVKSHICHSGKAKDANIRTALIDLFGPQGTKKERGPTYGISADVWSALAIAETFRSGDYTPYILSADKPENKIA